MAWRAALRSCWGWEESQLIATAVSQANLAQHCMAGHRRRAVARLSEEQVGQALDHTGRGSLSPITRALLELAEQLTLTPEEMSREKVGRAVDAGASVDRLRDAVEIVAVMGVMNRITTTLNLAPQERRPGGRS
jgi:uncharacterized peroxidase-related enzyme